MYMLSRLKFRISGPSASGKFFFNLQEGVSLYLDDYFRPVPQEFAYYALLVRSGRTSLAFLKAPVRWNNDAQVKGPVELRPGHTLWANGASVEILECPVVSATASEAEITKFMDIRASSGSAEREIANPMLDASVDGAKAEEIGRAHV